MQVIEFIDFNAITSVLVKNPTMQSLFLAVTDPKGNVLSSTPWRKVCCRFHRENDRTAFKCRQSDSILANRLNTGEKYALYTCFNSLTDAATPIHVDGEHIGNLVAGQVFIRQPDMDYFARQAGECGFDRAAYLAAIAEVPIVSEAELRGIMAFYSELTSLLGTMAKQAYEYKELSGRLSRRTAELEYVNGELEAFSYSVSHDLRAPLRHIMGFIELFNKKYAQSLDAQGLHYFDVIHSSAQNMSRLIDELLQFSRNGRAEMMREATDMNELVAEVRESAESSLKGRQIQWNVSRLEPARCDRAMLRLVWHNLIDNAVKFTGKTAEPEIAICNYPENGETVYCIQDNGAGFDMRYAQKLFGVFQRMHAKDEFDGTGIGLANVKRIVSRHGGRIWAEASPGRGASFYFTIPGKGE